MHVIGHHQSTPQQLGGKGFALHKLHQAGLPVPDGFVVPIDVFRQVMHANNLSLPAPADVDPADASDHQARIMAATVPQHLWADIAAAYADTSGLVAVRSSANVEDGASHSYAGQFSSVLNVASEATLQKAIIQCWASLYSRQVIHYNQAEPGEVGMAVVVQTMVPAAVSGVLFTAHPLTGNRDHYVVNLHTGTGEALVGGQVSTDELFVPRACASLADGKLPRHALLTRGQLRQLADLAAQVEAVFDGVPQDIEWALAGERLWLLQARPITHLPDPDLWAAPYANARLVRRQVVENMPEALSPLFADLYVHEALDEQMQAFIDSFALPVNLDHFVQRPLFTTVNGYGYCRYEFKLGWPAMRQMPALLWWSLARSRALFKDLQGIWQDGLAEHQQVNAWWSRLNLVSASADDLVAGMVALTQAEARLWYYITMMVGMAKISEGILDIFLRYAVRADISSTELVRGASGEALQGEYQLATLATHLSAQSSEAEFAHAAQTYLQTYGHQVYNLDFAAPTMREASAPVLQALRHLAGQTDPVGQLHRRQAQLQRARDRALCRARYAVGPLRRRVLDRLVAWARQQAPLRDTGLFMLGAGWPQLRRLALHLGQRLVQDKQLEQAADVFFFTAAELRGVATDTSTDHRAAVQARHVLHAQQQKLHPPARVPLDMRLTIGPFDLTRFLQPWETQKHNRGDATTLQGFAVSPGVVTGPACVLMSPQDFDQMRADSILVCPTTTPAWTPLFSQASGLVTDIGALLAHGSIVAREYGIPAVLGTGNATRRIRTGQQIRVNGSTGTVTLL